MRKDNHPGAFHPATTFEHNGKRVVADGARRLQDPMSSFAFKGGNKATRSRRWVDNKAR